MKVKPVAVRAAAAQGIDEAIDYYLTQGGAALASRFVLALQEAYRHIRRFPATGALRYAAELNIPGLRFWPLKRFPYLVFYVEREDSLDVLLVLHGKRDIPAWLRDGEQDK
jgi:toxin ParE1/3/4